MRAKTLVALLICILFSSVACNLPFNIDQLAGGNQGQPTATAIAPQDATAVATPTQVTSSPMVLAVKEAHESSDSPKYKIDARWPYLQWNADPRANAFNTASESFVTGEVQHFKDGVMSTPEDPNFKDLFSSININFSQTHETHGILSILYKTDFYVAGAAHPGHYSYVINYDLRQGKVIELADLFKPGAAYLDLISQTCIADLKSRDVLAWEDGALPNPENYKNWNITPDGLLITFDEYQVAPYALGPQAVMVSYDKLKDLARPDGPLAAYLK